MLKQNVAILGASPHHDRYSYKAMVELRKKGHQVFLVSPKYADIEGQPVYANLCDVKKVIDTVTVYVNPNISSQLGAQLLKVKPSRVIFNPGSENPELAKELSGKGIECLEACTLVLLSTNQF